MFFPRYSNIYQELKEVLYNRAVQTTNLYTQGGVSGLSCWIRATSGAGLILESIHSPQGFKSAYGNSEKPGIIGYAWDGETPIEIDGTGRGLRPSPVITNLNIDEKARGSLKVSSFTIKCFTKEQMDKITQYFLEPGFHVLLEWGWNVQDSYSQKVQISSECDIAAYDNWKVIKEKRKASKYQYDASLGIVVGGGVKFGDSETFELDVKVSGAGIAAEYMQTHRSGNRTDIAEGDSAPAFGVEKEGKSTPPTSLFKQMYNALPNSKQIQTVKSWVGGSDEDGNDWTYEGNYVNFDEVAREALSEALAKGTTITNKGGESTTLPTDVELFDEERFIRFEMAVEIMNSYALKLKPVESNKCPNLTTKNLTINIKDTPIKAFPHMWSTDKTKLYIPNTTAPNFNLSKALFPEDATPIKYINFDDLNNNDNIANLHPLVKEAPPNDERAEKNGSANDPASGQSRPVPFAFPCTYDLDESVLSYTCDESVDPITESAGFWGWLKDLYINFDFFKECLEKPNFNTRDVLYEMLNGMSAACNSLWDFQIMEQPKTNDENGPSELTVVDFRFTGKTDPEDDKIAQFQTRGTQSPFTSISFDMTVQGAMMSSVMIKKMSGGKVDGTGDSEVVMFGSVFGGLEDKVGTVLMQLQKSMQEAEDDASGTDTEAESLKDKEAAQEEAIAKAYEVFADRAGIFSRYQDRKEVLSGVGKTSTTEKIKEDIETLLCIGTWNDPTSLKAVELIDRGFKSEAGVSGEQNKSDNNSQNPPLGLAKIDFSLHGVSGFKVGDKIRFDGLPEKFGHPNFYQVMSVKHSISGNQWITSVSCEMRMIGKEE